MSKQTARIDGRKIGFLGGGNMAGAMIRGLIHSGAVAADQIWASDVKGERLDELRDKYGDERRASAPWLVAPGPSSAAENISTFCAFSMRCKQENFASPFRRPPPRCSPRNRSTASRSPPAPSDRRRTDRHSPACR